MRTKNLYQSKWRPGDGYGLHCHGCTFGFVTKVKSRWKGPEYPDKGYIFQTCVEMVAEMSRSKAKLVFPALGTAFRTLFMDTDPTAPSKGL